MRENILSATCGVISGVLAGIGREGLTTILMGVLGGIGGLIGKELYNHFKKKIKTWKK